VLIWKRRGPGLGIYADGAAHRYSIYSIGARNWVVACVPLHEGKPRTAGKKYDEHNPSQAFAKEIAQKWEDAREAPDHRQA